MLQSVRCLSISALAVLGLSGCLTFNQPTRVEPASVSLVTDDTQPPVLTYATDFQDNNLVVNVTSPHDDLEILSSVVGIQHAGSHAWRPTLDVGGDPVIYQNVAKALRIVGMWEWQETDYWFLVLEVRRLGQQNHFKLEVHRGTGS